MTQQYEGPNDGRPMSSMQPSPTAQPMTPEEYAVWHATTQPPPKKRKRVFMWFFLVVQVLFLVWVISGIASGSGHASNCGTLDQKTCDAAAHVGTGIGVGIVIGLWVAVDLILGISRLIVVFSRRKG